MLQGSVGGVVSDVRQVGAGSANVGMLAFGPYAEWPEGDAKASFELSIDVVNSSDDARIARIEVFDSTANQTLRSVEVSRRDFANNSQKQNFDVYFSTQGRASHKMETRVWSFGNAYLKVHEVLVDVDAGSQGMPFIVNKSSAPQAKVQSLISAAFAGLGFGTKVDAPNKNDIVFVSDELLAWIDQTGFVGKLNGLWKLNGQQGDALDFVLKKDNRPLNFLIPGEWSDGAWGGTYVGAEHFELPSKTPEYGDTSCTNGSICNWFAYNEAPHMLAKTPGVNLDHWSACNGVKPGFGKLFAPMRITETADTLEIWYEDKLVKMADNTGPKDGNDCGLDYLFPNKQRAPVYLQTGYLFQKGKSYVDRYYKYRNSAGNPVLNPSESLIGGFVITDLNRRMHEKAFYNQFRWTNGLNNSAGVFPAKVFQPLFSGWPSSDVVVGWGQTSYVASTVPEVKSGASIALSHPEMGTSKNQEDIGTCVCVVHGGMEMGGGVLSAQTGCVPLNAGQTSLRNTRRLWLPTTGNMLPDWQ